MTTVLEIHLEEKLPLLSDDEMEEANEVIEQYPDVELKRILVSEGGIAVEEWEAPDAETVEEIIDKVMGPNHCDTIVEVDELDI